MKLIQLAKRAKETIGQLITGVGHTAARGTEEAIQAAGGRRFFYGGWLIPIWILATFLLGMPEVLILAGAGGISFAVGWEGFRDVRATTKDGS